MAGDQELNRRPTPAGTLESDLEPFCLPEPEIARRVERVETTGGGINREQPGERMGFCMRGPYTEACRNRMMKSTTLKRQTVRPVSHFRMAYALPSMAPEKGYRATPGASFR
jgi:hypothetical protein